jgi:hypothetical protein
MKSLLSKNKKQVAILLENIEDFNKIFMLFQHTNFLNAVKLRSSPELYEVLDSYKLHDKMSYGFWYNITAIFKIR